MKSLRVALTRPTSLFKGGNDEEFGPLCLFNIQKKGTGKNPIPLLSNHHKIDFLFIFNRNINPKIIFSFLDTYAARLHFQTIIVKQKFLYSNHNIPFIISSGFNAFFHHNNFFERVISFFKRTGFLLPFFFIGNIVCRLNIVSLTALISYEINFYLLSDIFALGGFFSKLNYTDINIISSVSKFVINDILHQMSFFYLPKIKPCVTKSGIFKIQLIRRADVFFTLYIIPLCFAEQERVF